MKDEGKDAYTISEYQRYYAENERQAYRQQAEFRELWPEYRDAERAGAADRPAPSGQGGRDEAAGVGGGDGVTGRLIRMPLRPGSEPWLSKRQIAAYFGFSTRWVELRVREGMPSADDRRTSKVQAQRVRGVGSRKGGRVIVSEGRRTASASMTRR